MPTLSARYLTSDSRSPETSITLRTPYFGFKCSMTEALSLRGASWKRNAGVYRPSTNIRHSKPLTNSGNGSVRSVTFFRPVISISLPAILPFKPSPGLSRILSTESVSIFSCFAAITTAVASGCFE
jgi:hypothetical protein